MKIKSLKYIVGSYGSLAKGEVKDIDRATAADLIAAGYAEEVAEGEAEAPKVKETEAKPITSDTVTELADEARPADGNNPTTNIKPESAPTKRGKGNKTDGHNEGS